MTRGGQHVSVRGGPPWRRALCWIAFLAPFFYLTYWSANYITSLRHDVRSVVFAWEYHIPFLAWTIVPYCSMNLLYPLSVFTCRTRDELDVHCRRLVTAQVIAIACFLLFPLKFTFHQPETHGVPGYLFAALTHLDKPFNQAPSLHIAELAILWGLFPAHLPRPGRWLLHIWFTLIGLSVLTTFEHHFFDVVTGVLLGVWCMWLWPQGEPSPLAKIAFARDRRRLARAARFLVGAAVIAEVALRVGGTGLWLLWPGVSLSMVAMNYAIFGTAGFQKDAQGDMSAAARLLLFPYLVALVIARFKTGDERTPLAIGDGV